MFEENTYKTILARLLARVPDTLDKREGSVIFDASAPAAMEFARLYIELERMAAESFGGTASREALIQRCAERGIAPYGAACAVLRAQTEPPAVDVTGCRFSMGALNYTAKRRLAPGSYELACETPGAEGSRRLGPLVPIEYIDGLESARAVEVLIPGEDEEDTEALRRRYFDSFSEIAFGGNRRDYITRTNAIAGVGSCKVTSVWNGGLRPAALRPAPAVDEWVAGALPALDETCAAWLRSVYDAARGGLLTVGGTVLVTILDAQHSPASGALVAAVQEALDPPAEAGEGGGLAPIGHVVTVQSAKGVPVRVAARLTFETGYDWAGCQSGVEAAVEAYLLSLRAAWAESASLVVRLSQIETRILAVQGVVDIAGVTLNGAAENLTLGAYEAPVLDGVREEAAAGE